jgi:glycosyltransferase involved in cell wall biosynthesis
MKGGDNRQAGFERTTHDVISFFDADDIPHPDRVAVLRRLFAQRDIMHLCHCHVPFNRDVVSDEQLSLFSPIPDDIDRFIIGPDCISQAYFPNRDLMECLSITRAYGYGLTRNPLIATGHPTVRRAVFDKVRWRDDNAVVLGVADDYDFAMECVYYFQKSVILDLALANVRLRSATKASKLKNGRKRAIKYVRRLRGWWNLSFGKI